MNTHKDKYVYSMKNLQYRKPLLGFFFTHQNTSLKDKNRFVLVVDEIICSWYVQASKNVCTVP